MAIRTGITTLVLCLLLAQPASAGVVRTLDGKVIQGEIKLDGDHLAVTHAGKTHKVSLGDILHADLLAPVLDEPASSDVPDIHFKDIRKWTATDVGNTKIKGKTAFEGPRVILAGAGMDVAYREDLKRDDFYFYHRPLAGDGQIIAKVISFTQDGRAARVGVMIRAGLDPQAPNAMLSLSGGKWSFQFRTKPTETTQREERGGAGDQGYLKLVRRGTHITAFGSRDGREWKDLGSCKGLPDGELVVGLAVASRQPEKVCTAIFEDVAVTAPSPSAETEPPAPPAIEKGILLRDGSLLGGEVRHADDSVVRFAQSGQKERSIPITDVARLLLRSVRTGAPTRDPGVAGAILRNGDFVDGEMRSVRDGRVKIDSVLFGLRAFATGEVSEILLRPADNTRSAYEINLTNGTAYLASDIRISGKELTLDTALLGPVTLPWPSVRDIRAHGPRIIPLASIPVAQVKGHEDPEAAYAIDALPGAADPAPSDLPYPRGFIGVGSDTTLTYDLDGEHRSFAASVIVPKGIKSSSRVRFAVIGDGKELWKSAPMTSLDPAASLAVPLAGVKRLELRATTDTPKTETSGLWIEPILVPAK